VAGIVGDDQHFVAKRWNEKNVDLGEHAGHFLADHAAETIGLHKIHGGEETCLAEEIGPGVVGLHFELIDCVIESDLFEGSGTFGEENKIEGVIGPVGERDFNRLHAEFGE